MARKMKVYRTSTGFHDAYVAAPSRAAALRAWGSDNDLFARGAAEEISDTRLMAEPLAHPGQVIRISRGSLTEQLAALPKAAPRPKKDRLDGTVKAEPTAVSTKKPKPRPSRAALDRAEAAAERLATKQRKAIDELAAREAELRRERRAMEAKHAKERERAAADIADVGAAYEQALAHWRSEG